MMRKPIFSATNLFADSANCVITGTCHEVTRPATLLQDFFSPSYAVQSDHDVFYFNNRKIAFHADAVDYVADIPNGVYRNTEAASAIAGAMNDEAGTDDIRCTYIEYEVTGGYTFKFVKDAGTLKLYCATGANKDVSVLPMLGYSGKVDRTGALTYYGDYPITSSGGHFEIASNGIIYVESTTATVPDGHYQRGELLAAMKDVLDTATTDTDWDVYYDEATLKFHISKGTTFTLDFSNDTDSIESLLGFPDSDQTGADDYVADEIRIDQYERIQFAFTDPKQLYSILIPKSHNLTEDAVIKIMADDTADWDAPDYSVTLTWNAKEIYDILSAVFVTTKAYAALQIADPKNPDGYIQFWVLAGPPLTDDSNFELSKFVNWGAAEDAIWGRDKVVSSAGVSSGNVKYNQWRKVYDFSFMTQTDKDKLDNLFEQLMDVRPFLLLMNQDSTLVSDVFARWVIFEGRPQLIESDAVGEKFTMRVSFVEFV